MLQRTKGPFVLKSCLSHPNPFVNVILSPFESDVDNNRETTLLSKTRISFQSTPMKNRLFLLPEVNSWMTHGPRHDSRSVCNTVSKSKLRVLLGCSIFYNYRGLLVWSGGFFNLLNGIDVPSNHCFHFKFGFNKLGFEWEKYWLDGETKRRTHCSVIRGDTNIQSSRPGAKHE